MLQLMTYVCFRDWSGDTEHFSQSLESYWLSTRPMAPSC